ncbi:hypothetical protein [Nocardioides pantholopis]|uniref:hypothetical protein n=1 Tax=Nocardioides pantholopis TaxID=2483798 RepID=UPI000F080009|nr:hypothetical protein [Nocardioides pantholopis]
MTTSSRLRTTVLPILVGAGAVAAVVGFTLLPSGPSPDPAASEGDAAAERTAAAHTTACRTWRTQYPEPRLSEELETVQAGASSVGGLDGVEFYFDWVDVEATAATLDEAVAATQQAATTPDLDETTYAAAAAHAEALGAYRAVVPEVATGEDLTALTGELAVALTDTREQLEAACADVADPAAG